MDITFTIKNVDPAVVEPTATLLGYTGFYGMTEPTEPGVEPEPAPETVYEFLQRHFVENYVRNLIQPSVVTALTQPALAAYQAAQKAAVEQLNSTVVVEVE